MYDLSGHERIRQRSDDGKALKYYAQCPGVLQGSQEKKRATLWDRCDHFGANIPMKIVQKKLSLLNVTSSILPLRVHYLCSFTFFKVSTLRKVRRQHCLSLLVLGIFLHRLEFDKNWSFCRYVLDSRLSRLDSTTA